MVTANGQDKPMAGGKRAEIIHHQRKLAELYHTFSSSMSFRLVRGRPFHCISFLSLDIISIAIRTFRASYTLRLIFFSSYCCCQGKTAPKLGT